MGRMYLEDPVMGGNLENRKMEEGSSFGKGEMFLNFC